MNLAVVVSQIGIAFGLIIVASLFLPAIQRAARVGFGFNVKWTTWFSVGFFVSGAFTHFILAWQMAMTPGASIHHVLASWAATVFSLLQFTTIAGTIVAATYEVVTPFARGVTGDRDEEIALLARQIIQVTREMREGRDSDEASP